jgi:hypothetical protein
VIERFQIKWDRRQVTCPQGRFSGGWSETTSSRGRASAHVTFAPADCLPCPVRGRCTRAKTGGGARALTFKTRREHELLRVARARQQTEDFAALYAQHAGIEGAISEGASAPSGPRPTFGPGPSGGPGNRRRDRKKKKGVDERVAAESVRKTLASLAAAPP